MNIPSQACFQLTHPSPELALIGRIAVLIGLFVLPVTGRTQEALPRNEIPGVARLMDSNVHADSLRCDVRPRAPFLDFNFRFETGLVLSFRTRQIIPGREFLAYLRVTPEGMAPVFLKAAFTPPSADSDSVDDSDQVYVQNGRLTVSGVFDVGEGRYTVELLVLHNARSCYRRWIVKTGSYRSRTVPLALQRGAVVPLARESWDGKLDPKGIRVTILLDAAPINPSSPVLHAWDRAFLLQMLASLLRQIPCQAVRLIVFDIQQQRVLFENHSFGASGFDELTDALKNVERATIPYQALRAGSARNFLLGLAQDQISATSPPDAVIFLGPATHFDERSPTPLAEPPRPRFFYFEFHSYGPLFPDRIDRLVKHLDGEVFPFSSANELAHAIQKVVAQVRPLDATLIPRGSARFGVYRPEPVTVELKAPSRHAHRATLAWSLSTQGQ